MAKRGRPPGAKNHSRTHLVAEPVRCPRCGSTDAVQRRLLSRNFNPGERDGVPHTHIARWAFKCRACGSHLCATAFEYLPAQTKRQNGLL